MGSWYRSYIGRIHCGETKRGDNLNWRTWSAMGALRGPMAVFSFQGVGAEMARWAEIGLSGLTLRVLRVWMSGRNRSLQSLPTGGGGQIIRPNLMWDFVSGQGRMETI